MQSSSGQSQGTSGSQVEEAEDEESSSSSSSLVPPNELETFREKWKQDLAVSKGNQNLDINLDDEPDSIEEKVRFQSRVVTKPNVSGFGRFRSSKSRFST